MELYLVSSLRCSVLGWYKGTNLIIIPHSQPHFFITDIQKQIKLTLYVLFILDRILQKKEFGNLLYAPLKATSNKLLS